MLLRQTGARVCVAPRRSDAARKLVEAGCDVILCDDGLQHLALARDFEIAVVDGSRGMGNGRLLPAGPLREPASRLSSVDAVVVQGEGPAAMTGAAPMLRMTLAADELRSVAGSERRGLAWLNGREVHAVTGIGNPHRFFDLLRSLGAQVREHALGDHHRFTAGDIEFADELPVLMTAKDAVKCTTLAGARHWFLTVSAQFAPEDEEWLLGRILALGSPEGRPRG
jgi:tetraacyldisaccharide 4'-kinase